jgi:uncharacterized membrane protein YesL
MNTTELLVSAAVGIVFSALLIVADAAWYWAILAGAGVFGASRQTFALIRYLRAHPKDEYRRR